MSLELSTSISVAFMWFRLFYLWFLRHEAFPFC